MTVDSYRPGAIHAQASGLRDVLNAIAFYGLFGFGLLIPVVLPLYAVLNR